MKLLLALTLSALIGISYAADKTPAPAVSAVRANALPVDSIMQMNDKFVAQDGKEFTLSDRRGSNRQGHPQVVALFYSSCKYVCPLMIDSTKAVEKALTAAELAQLRVLFVSMDPKRDTPKALSDLATSRKLDTRRWTLAGTDENGVRTLAALLKIRYRALANGEFNHTSALTLLDRDGRILARTENMGSVPDPVFLAAVKAACAEETR